MRAAGAGAGTPAGEHAWVRLVPWWHVGFAATVVTTSAFAAFNLQSTGRLAAMLSLYAGLALWYVLLPAKFSSRKAGHIYLAGALAIFVAAEFTYPGSGFLFFILIPQCFVLLRLRTSYVAVIGLLVVGAAAELSYSGVNQATVASVALFGVISLVFAFLLGGYITRIIEQSHQRAVLIEDLERTRAELAEVSREAGALAERERLAREIHDALAQGFTSVIMLLQAAQAALERGDLPTARRQLALAEPAARDGLGEARSLIAALVPLALQGSTLPSALQRVCEDSGARFGFSARLEVRGQVAALSHNAEIVLLRGTQEALTNVGRHAKASSATVVLAFGEGDASVVVADDGAGFDPVHASGFGVSQLRSRATEVGGHAEVTSSAGEGTTVRVSVPVVGLAAEAAGEPAGGAPVGTPAGGAAVGVAAAGAASAAPGRSTGQGAVK